jgi:hypothetical protein
MRSRAARPLATSGAKATRFADDGDRRRTLQFLGSDGVMKAISS